MKLKYMGLLIALAFVISGLAFLAPSPVTLAAKGEDIPLDVTLGGALPYYYNFINPQPSTTVSGTVNIQFSCNYNGYQLYRVRIAVYKGSSRLTNYYDMTYAGSGTYTISWGTTSYSDGTGYRLRFVCYRTSSSYTSVYCDNLTINNGGSPPPDPDPDPEPPGTGEKIAVFFSASDAFTPASYFTGTLTTILRNEGFTKFFYFRDSSNPQADMNTVDNYETSADTVFIYVLGHGNNNGQHSYTCFRPSASIVYSNTFRTWYNALEAPRKCLFVESCHSGDWADDFRASPYLAMSTSDETHVSYCGTYGGVQVGVMTYYFFQAIKNGYTGYNAWNYARGYASNQYAKAADYSSYVWFA